MAPKQVNADPKTKAKAKAKALAGYVTPPEPVPYQDPDTFIAQMLETQDMAGQVSMSSSASLRDVMNALEERLNNLNKVNVTIKEETQRRQSLIAKAKTAAFNQAKSQAKAKAKQASKNRRVTIRMTMGNTTVTVTVPLRTNIGPIRDMFVNEFNQQVDYDERILVKFQKKLFMWVGGVGRQGLHTNPRKSLFYHNIRNDVDITMEYPHDNDENQQEVNEEPEEEDETEDPEVDD